MAHNIHLFPFEYGTSLAFQMGFMELMMSNVTCARTLTKRLDELNALKVDFSKLDKYNYYSNSQLSTDDLIQNRSAYLQTHWELAQRYQEQENILPADYYKLNRFIFFNNYNYFFKEYAFVEPRIVFTRADFECIQGILPDIDDIYLKKKGVPRMRTEKFNFYEDRPVYRLEFPKVHNILHNFNPLSIHLVVQNKKLLYLYQLIKRMHENTTVDMILLTFERS